MNYLFPVQWEPGDWTEVEADPQPALENLSESISRLGGTLVGQVPVVSFRSALLVVRDVEDFQVLRSGIELDLGDTLRCVAFGEVGAYLPVDAPEDTVIQPGVLQSPAYRHLQDALMALPPGPYTCTCGGKLGGEHEQGCKWAFI